MKYWAPIMLLVALLGCDQPATVQTPRTLKLPHRTTLQLMADLHEAIGIGTLTLADVTYDGALSQSITTGFQPDLPLLRWRVHAGDPGTPLFTIIADQTGHGLVKIETVACDLWLSIEGADADQPLVFTRQFIDDFAFITGRHSPREVLARICEILVATHSRPDQ